MLAYIKQTWVDLIGGGTPESAARLNYIEQGIYDAHHMPTARAYNNAAQVITTGVRTTVPLNSERYDTDACHDVSALTSRLTAKTAGVYAIIGMTQWDPDSNGIRGLELWMGPSNILIAANYCRPEATNNIVHEVPTQWLFNVNDYVEMKVIHDSGSNRTIGAGTLVFSELMWTRVAS